MKTRWPARATRRGRRERVLQAGIPYFLPCFARVGLMWRECGSTAWSSLFFLPLTYVIHYVSCRAR